MEGKKSIPKSIVEFLKEISGDGKTVVNNIAKKVEEIRKEEDHNTILALESYVNYVTPGNRFIRLPNLARHNNGGEHIEYPNKQEKQLEDRIRD